MNVSGRDLIELLEKDQWQLRGKATHGVFLFKQFPGERYPRTIVVPGKKDSLPNGTLAAILSVKQTGLGRSGLQELMSKYKH